MNANRMVSMLINMVIRKLMRKGVDAGVKAVANRKGANGQPGQGKAPDTAKMQKNARQSMRAMRKLTRF